MVKVEPEKTEKQKKIDQTIHDYFVNLVEQLKEKQLFSFWVFPDHKTFKKINKKTSDDIQAMIKKDVDRYKNRQIAEISICPFHDAKKDSFERQKGIWAAVGISVFQIDAKGILGGKDNKQSWGTDIRWEEKDLRVSKITFKLLERLMRLTSEKKCLNPSLIGLPLTHIIKKLKEKNINLDDVLTPLSGI